MMNEPYGITTFCDDIRYEVSGKLTLIGCYTGEMTFHGPPPGQLPIFSAFVNIRLPIDLNFRTLQLRVWTEIEGSRETIFEAEIEANEEAPNNPGNDATGPARGEMVKSIVAPLSWSPFRMPAPGLVRVRALLDGEKEVRLGSLKVNFLAVAAEGAEAEE